MNKMNFIGVLGLLLFVGLVSANELQVDLNAPIIIRASCVGSNASANIMVYSGLTQNPDNLVVSRSDMINISPTDFVFTWSFDATGVYTAYEECIFGGGFVTEQSTVITVTEFYNLITNTTLSNYDYEALLYYDVFFKLDPTRSKTVLFDVANESISFQPKELNIVNVEGNRLQTIKNAQSSARAVVNDNVLTYPNIYDDGFSLQYLINSKYVKEDLIIENASILPVAHSNLGVNPLLELNFLMTTTTKHFIVDGVEWNMSAVSKVTTSNKIVVKDNSNNTIYVMEVPVAFDSNGSSITGVYTLERDSGDKVKVAVKISYSWLKDSIRVFPVFVDPTLDTPDGTAVFGSQTPMIVVGNFTIPAGVPFAINQTIMFGDAPLLDAECECDIVDDLTGFKAVDYRSFYNDGNGLYTYTWQNPYVGNFTLVQYCWRGDTLDLTKIYSNSSIGVY